MHTVSIATELHASAIETLSISQYAINRLRARGIKTLGQLHGMSIAAIGGFSGVGAGTLDKILRAIQELEPRQARGPSSLTDDVGRGSSSSSPGSVMKGHGPLSSGLAVPLPIRHWPTSALGLLQTTLAALTAHGIHTIGDFDGATSNELITSNHIGIKGAARIEAALKDLANLPTMEVLRHNASGTPLAPMVSTQLLRAVASATCPAEEIQGAVAGLSARNAEIVRLRWAKPHGRRLTLEDIAKRFGITRERARQITQKQDDILRASNLWLPRLARIVRVVDAAGGAMPTHALVKRATELGSVIGSDVLPYIETLGELGLIPRIVFSERGRLWVSEAGFDSWLSGNQIAELRQDITRRIRQSLNRVGCVPISALAHAPFGLRHALSLASGNDIRFRRLDDHLMPWESYGSALHRWVEQMLVIATELPLDEIATALRHCKTVNKGHRERIVVPPTNVLRELLTGDGRFALSETMARLSAAPERQLLSATEQVVVAAIEAQGNIASWTQIMDAAKAAGCKDPTVGLVLQEPYIIRRSTGIYALRGRPVAPEMLKRVIRERSLARRACVKRLAYSGQTRARVVYELTPFAANGGVLPVPGRLRTVAHKRWRVRVNGGRELQVRMRNGFIWPLKAWFRDSGIKPGDLLIADFDISSGTIDLDTAS